MTNWIPDLSTRRGPTYLAIASALAEDIEKGLLEAGARMPTHRDLAYRLGVTVGTVSRAYAEATARGLIDGEVGRGTFVRRRVRRDLSEVLQRPDDGIDFGLNYPPLGAEEEAAFRETLRDLAGCPDLGSLMCYAPHGGEMRHREAASAWLREQGVKAEPRATIVTNGAQHGMLVAFSALCEPGDAVLADRLTFPGMVSIALALRLRLHALDMDAEGTSPEALDHACRTFGAKAYYCMPTLQNPTTSSMTVGRRREIAEIARRHNLAVVEDDIYRFLMPDAPAPIAALAPERTIYVTSAAKQVAPGLRVGAIAAPSTMLAKLETAVRTSTWMAAPPMAEIFARWVADGTARRLGEVKRRELAIRQRLAADAFAGLKSRAHPTSMHLWLRLPDHWNEEEFAHAAMQRGVTVTPGGVFAQSQGAGRGHLRICVGNPKTRADVERGLAVIADLALGQPTRTRSIV